MKKILYVAVTAVIAIGLFSALQAGQGRECPMAKAAAAKKCNGMCPKDLKGVTVTVENIAEGVVVKFTAKDAATIKQIQELSVAHFAKPAGNISKEKKPVTP